MTIGEAKNRARALWGDKVKVQVLPPRFQIIVPSKERGKFVLVGEGPDWYFALKDAEKNRNELAQGVIAERERKPWYYDFLKWFER